MSELEIAILNLLQANPDIIAQVIKDNPAIVLDVLKTNNIETQRIFQVLPDEETGSIWSYRKQSDVDSRARLSQNLHNGNNENFFPTWVFGEGNRAPVHSFGFANVVDNDTGEQLATVLELNSRDKNGDAGNPLGIALNVREWTVTPGQGTAMTLIAEDGAVNVRNEYQGRDIVAVIK